MQLTRHGRADGSGGHELPSCRWYPTSTPCPRSGCLSHCADASIFEQSSTAAFFFWRLLYECVCVCRDVILENHERAASRYIPPCSLFVCLFLLCYLLPCTRPISRAAIFSIMLPLIYAYTLSEKIVFGLSSFIITMRNTKSRSCVCLSFPFAVSQCRDQKHMHEQVTRADLLYRASRILKRSAMRSNGIRYS
jgi:hypothetical protein